MITLQPEHGKPYYAALQRTLEQGLDIRRSFAAPNVYYVQSATDRTVRYQVSLLTVAGKACTDCNCKAGQNDVMCQHVALAIRSHLDARKAAREALCELPLCSECGEATGFRAMHAKTDYCEQCCSWIDECRLVA